MDTISILSYCIVCFWRSLSLILWSHFSCDILLSALYCVALVHQWQYQVLHWRPRSSWAPCHDCTDLLSVHHSHHPHLLSRLVAGGLIDT